MLDETAKFYISQAAKSELSRASNQFGQNAFDSNQIKAIEKAIIAALEAYEESKKYVS